MATRKERRAEALRTHVAFCQERTRQNMARANRRLEAEYATQQTEAQEADAEAVRRRATFKVV